VALQEARERGDLSTELSLNSVILCMVRLAADDPDGARQAVEWAAGALARQDFRGPHAAMVWMARVWIHLYKGDAATAWNEILEPWPTHQMGSFGVRVQLARINWSYYRAAGALAVAASSACPGPLIRNTARLARRMEREQRAWSYALAQVLRSAMAAARGDRAGAAEFLVRADALLEAADMRLHAAAARRRRGELLGGDEGRRLIARADDLMADQRVRDPARLTAVLAPGFPG
jgi:hypothetical protein